MDSDKDAHCGLVIFHVLCDKQVVNCQEAAVYQLAAMPDDEQTATGRQSSLLHATVQSIYLPVIKPSLDMASCTVGGKPMATDNSRHYNVP